MFVFYFVSQHSLGENSVQILELLTGSFILFFLFFRQELRLKSNCLTELPDDLGKLRRIKHMDVGMNQLNTLPSNMDGFELLESLDLQRNQLTNACITKKFERLINLTSLNLTMNCFSIIPIHIGQLKKLQELKFAANDIWEIPDSLSAGPLQTTLLKLWLPNNKLSKIPLSVSLISLSGVFCSEVHNSPVTFFGFWI